MDGRDLERTRPYTRVGAHVRLHARRRPDQQAIVGNHKAVSYRVLDCHLRSVTHALNALGLRRGSQVAVGHSNFYIQLLLVFAWENLGATTASFRPREGADCHGLLAGSSLVMSESPPSGPCTAFFALTETWVRSALAGPGGVGDELGPPSAGEVAIVLRSSGTSGQPRRMALTHGMLRRRLAHWVEHLGLDARSRYFAANHFAMGTMYHSASACLRLGATFMFDTDHTMQSALPQYRPTHLTLMPFQLGTLLDEMPPSGPRLVPELALSVIGGKFTTELRRRALQRLCGRVMETYGTNEAYLHSVVDADGVGTVTWGIEAEVVDGDGRTLPPGAVGQVRLRGQGVVRGYIDDDAATAELFRDGWFHPGDLALFVAPGRLRLVGRRDDVLNIGGMKVACVDLEAKIVANAPVREVALLQDDALGGDSLVAACVVLDPAHAPPPTLAETIGGIVRCRCAVRLVDVIPRTPEGKIRRAMLRQALFDPATGPLSAAPAAA